MKKLIFFVFLNGFLFAQPDLSGISFCIDPGHGGSDQGAIGPTGWKERVTNDGVAFALENYLKSFNADTVILTRRTNISLSLSDREAIANNAGVTMFHSVHHNSISDPASDYTLVLYEETSVGTPQWPGQSDVLSDSMSARLSRFQKIQDIGGRGDLEFLGFNLGVLNNLNMPGQLSEGNFISNPIGEARQKNALWQQSEAQALANAILEYFGEPLPASGTLVGTLRHSVSNKPLTNATISLLETGDSYTTDYYGNGFFRFDSLNPGNYTAKVTTIFDTTEQIQAVASEGIKSVLIKLLGETTVAGAPPEQPQLKSVTAQNADSIHIEWYPSGDSSIDGYRLYGSTDGSNWNIPPGARLVSKTATALNLEFSGPLYLKLVTVRADALGDSIESDPTDSYGINIDTGNTPILIVDGFDRYGGSGSWGDPFHDFVVLNGRAIQARSAAGFASCANNAVVDGSVQLTDYQTVIWVLGDESTVDKTFDATEKTKVKTFLENGGNLFVTGSEIGWEIGRSASASADLNFYQNYLKAGYLEDDSGNLTASGISGGIFEGFSLSYGQTYPEDYPDVLEAKNGSLLSLKYGNNKGAAVQYSGTFGSSVIAGKLVYIAFPFETIGSEDSRNELMARVLDFFGYATRIEIPGRQMPVTAYLEQNYPNPFNPETSVRFYLPEPGPVTIRIFDTTGRLVDIILAKTVLPAGDHTFRWNAQNAPGHSLASGIYFLRMESGSFSKTIRMILLK